MQPGVASFVFQFMCQVAGQFIVPPQKVVICFRQIWGTKAHNIYIIYESYAELNITVSDIKSTSPHRPKPTCVSHTHTRDPEGKIIP